MEPALLHKRVMKPYKARELTPQQRDFADKVGRDAMSVLDAYDAVYKGGSNCKLTRSRAAWKLARNTNVAKVIADYRVETDKQMKLDAVGIRMLLMDTLVDKVQNASTETNQLRAIELLGKTEDIGLFKERIETSNVKSTGELEREIREKVALLFGKPKLIENEA